MNTLINLETNTILLENLQIADNFIKRSVGFMGRKHPEVEEGIIITPCSWIHTCFMKFDIDVIFLDNSWRVIRIVKGLKPFKIDQRVRNSIYVIEIPTNFGVADKIRINDQLKIQ